MKRLLAILLLAAAASGCTRKTAETPAPAVAVAKPERINLLLLTNGGSVVSRTDEALLQQGAAASIDGDPGSYYSTPRGDTQQSIVFALPSRTRLTAIGAMTPDKEEVGIRKLHVESSTDGRSFLPLTDLSLELKDDPQWTELRSPVEATHLRVSITKGGSIFGILKEMLASGEPLAGRTRRDAQGCWMLNTAPGRMMQEGADVSGIFSPGLAVVGGVSSNFYRVAWLDGPMFGLGAFTLDPESKRLSGLMWHERADEMTVGEYWMGERTESCTGPDARVALDALAATWLQRAGWFPLYGLTFDGKDALLTAESETALGVLLHLIATGKPITVESHEFRESNPAANKARASARINALQQELARRGVDVSRVRFVSHGSDAPPHKLATPVNRAMYSTIAVRVAG